MRKIFASFTFARTPKTVYGFKAAIHLSLFPIGVQFFSSENYPPRALDFTSRFLLERRKTLQRRTCFGFNTFGVLKIRNEIILPRNSLHVFVGVPF
ncbi:MAG: hypothetical protein J6A55_01230 [Oscillospiraceae bacterium]|nr:hypothetical protein [Oscillospiraceae bacterium]